ncbi:AIR synthase-related protein [Desulfurivibrio alkaliphilus]|uniref:Phosphoribosylformylglycinamidine synthase subunit PurL n=1 Tax=Desulfurivibrio alkaliphilus (strain DSM 19089 / UNIQEM U267 / AHT2) TaxID=589865 RepID=D6Z4T8_DESAT|nr:AIR synthase-related protein [Desulfurivibrio alkaliphilus]ADH86563.1 phosphoribosylformylglycinamidine synthase II [Desulfurivibrio alkaliphilus AHT 2]
MLARIEVGLKTRVNDSYGEATGKRIAADLQLAVDEVRTIKVFTVEADITPEQLQAAAAGPYCDPVTQDYSLDALALRQELPFDWCIEVGFRPGVTDNEGRTASQALALLLGRPLSDREAVYTSMQYLLKGELSREQATTIAAKLLANELIERFTILSHQEFVDQGGIPAYAPRVTGDDQWRVAEIDLNVDDDTLQKISRDGVLALTLDEMQVIRDHLQDPQVVKQRRRVGLGEKITDVELEVLAQSWSEHCKHKIFNAEIHYEDTASGQQTVFHSLFDTFIKAPTAEIRRRMGDNDWCLSVFKDNAGVIRFTQDWNVAFKVETHNSPSALDPYGGALTGIVGVNRDPFGTGMGAKLIANTDVFCFASPFYEDPLPARLLHPKRIFEGVRLGVEHGGNKSGIPTVNGSLVFDSRFAGKPLVFCGTVGIMPALVNGRPSEHKKANPGDLIVMTGGRIGKDGIHGATFSSEELHEGSPATAVQIGDPITQKRMFDCLLKARDLGLYSCITDNGAGGLSSSVGEMAEDTGGFELHLDKAPLKYPGLQPWEIMISEAQERMTLAVPPGKIDEFMALCQRMEVEATVLGTFTDSGKFHVLYQGQTVACLEMAFVHHGLPPMQLSARWTPPVHPELQLPDHPDLGAELHTLLGRLNVCSKEYVVRQYDHEVQAGSVVKPLTGAANDGPSDAAVIRPLLDSCQGLVIAHGICPKYSDIDTYHMAACAVDEAIRNAVATGAGLNHMAGLDNFCWCDPVLSEKTPDGPYKLAQLVRANQALAACAVAFGVPCISGKDSMKNDYMMNNVKISIPPTLLFSVVAKIDDVNRAVTMDAKKPGDLVYLLGTTYDELGGSEYAALLGGVGNNVPKVNPETARRRYEALHQAMTRGLVASAHDLSDGGLAVAAAESAFAGGLGLDIDLGLALTQEVYRDDVLLFSESASRLLVTVAPADADAFEQTMAGAECSRIGVVTSEPVLRISGLGGETVLVERIEDLKKSWQTTLDF